MERPKTLHVQKVYPPLGYPDLEPEPVTGPELVTTPMSPATRPGFVSPPMTPHTTTTPPDFSPMGLPLSQPKADVACQADDVSAPQPSDVSMTSQPGERLV